MREPHAARPASFVRRLGTQLSHFHRTNISLPRAQRIIAVAGELMRDAIPANPTLLDVGCGDGKIGRGIADALLSPCIQGVDTLVQPNCSLPVEAYDGTRLPYEENAFDAVLLSDVLHHAQDAAGLLKESLRVARHAVFIKDHFSQSWWSHGVLWLMDVAGNASAGVAVTGRYFSAAGWLDLFSQAGAAIDAVRWPLRIHDLPWRVVTRSELQFAALVYPERAPSNGSYAGIQK